MADPILGRFFWQGTRSLKAGPLPAHAPSLVMSTRRDYPDNVRTSVKGQPTWYLVAIIIIKRLPYRFSVSPCRWYPLPAIATIEFATSKFTISNTCTRKMKKFVTRTCPPSRCPVVATGATPRVRLVGHDKLAFTMPRDLPPDGLQPLHRNVVQIGLFDGGRLSRGIRFNTLCADERIKKIENK